MEGKQLEGLEFLRKNEIRGMKCDINKPFAFISYSHDEHDAQIVMNVFKKLYEKGYNLWIDIANMPHDERPWYEPAQKAIRSQNCVLALYFRSESSMIKPNICQELDHIKNRKKPEGPIERIIPIDIWNNSDMDANKYHKEIYNSDDDEKASICDEICRIVSIKSNAIRLSSDLENNIHNLVREIAMDLQTVHVLSADPKGCTGLGNTREEEVSSECESKAVVQPVNTSFVENTENECEPEAVVQSVNTSVLETEKGNVTMKLTEFLKRFSSSTFKKDAYSKMRLVGHGKYEKYSTQFHTKSAEVVWEFVRKVLEDYGKSYVEQMIANQSGLVHPMFLTADGVDKLKAKRDNHKYRRLENEGLEDYYMCFQHGAYCWISDGLKPHLKALGFSLEEFDIEYT